MDMEQTKEQIKNEMSKVKKALYKEEAKSAMFAAIFALNLAVIFLYPFTLITLINIFAAFYMFGFFKPTIKKQEQLHLIMNGLKEMIRKIENPPKPQKPTSPWKT